MSDKKKDVGLFKKEISNIVEKISIKLLSVIAESDKDMPIETFTMALIQISAALAVQSSCTKDIFLQISELGYDAASKQEAKSIYSGIDFIKKKIDKDLN